ncbi:hypothetical protein I5L38_18515 [Serratia marcescens]|uniref:MrpH family fimbial adhesin n=1 Tax=Serratia TaxID=613 RepID=UPI0011F2D109|nr:MULTISPECIES: hypothetical protein [Serratia]MBH2729082.1 hypothetical protein [Serratia marcescens]MBH2869869.1 hypothetical protein [Serratia marcescens]NRN14052.1 hypothetical protein [Serratia marcescens]NRN37848.1 hypothetical protein [Serratia marcescens]
MNIVKRGIRCLLFLGGIYSASVSAGYEVYGEVEQIQVGSGDYKATFYIGNVDWEDARPLSCINRPSSRCLIRLRVELNRSGRSYLSLWETSVDKDVLLDAGVRTVGQYFTYLRDHKGVNITGEYELRGSYTYITEVREAGLCIIEEGFQIEVPLACSYRGMVTQPGCDVREGEISIEHGEVGADSVNGREASTELTVTCEGNGSVRLIAPSPEPKLRLAPDGSLYSKLYVGDTLLNDGVIVKAGPNGSRVKLTSRLGTVGTPMTGRFSGSVVVVLAKP